LVFVLIVVEYGAVFVFATEERLPVSRGIFKSKEEETASGGSHCLEVLDGAAILLAFVALSKESNRVRESLSSRVSQQAARTVKMCSRCRFSYSSVVVVAAVACPHDNDDLPGWYHKAM